MDTDLDVSRMTIYRRRVEYGLTNSLHLTLSDQQLQVVVREIHSQQPSLADMGKIMSKRISCHS